MWKYRKKKEKHDRLSWWFSMGDVTRKMKDCYQNLAYNTPKCENGKIYSNNSNIKYCQYCGFLLEDISKILEASKRIKKDLEMLIQSV